MTSSKSSGPKPVIGASDHRVFQSPAIPASRRLFHFGCYGDDRDRPGKASRRLHRVRDGAAFSDVSFVLYRWFPELEFAGTILNLPGKKTTRPEEYACLPDRKPDDLFVMTTRPPLNEPKPTGNQKVVPRSWSPLERDIFSAIKCAFLTEDSRREKIVLHESVAEILKKEKSELARAIVKAEFQTKGAGALRPDFLKQSGVKDNAKRIAIGYLFFAPDIPGGGQFLAAFSSGGLETQVFAHLLRTRYSGRVGWIVRAGKPHALIAEWRPEAIPARPCSFSFVGGGGGFREWGSSILLDAPLQTAARMSPSI